METNINSIVWKILKKMSNGEGLPWQLLKYKTANLYRDDRSMRKNRYPEINWSICKSLVNDKSGISDWWGKIVYAINSLEQLAEHLEKVKLHMSP